MDFLADFQSNSSLVRTRMDDGLRDSGKIFLALTPVLFLLKVPLKMIFLLKMDFLADFQSKFSVVRTRMDSGLRLSGKIFLALTPVSTGRDLILKIFQIMTQTYSVH